MINDDSSRFPIEFGDRKKIRSNELVDRTIKQFKETTKEYLSYDDKARVIMLFKEMVRNEPILLSERTLGRNLRIYPQYKIKGCSRKISLDGTKKRLKKALKIAITGGAIKKIHYDGDKVFILLWIISDIKHDSANVIDDEIFSHMEEKLIRMKTDIESSLDILKKIRGSQPQSL